MELFFFLKAEILWKMHCVAAVQCTVGPLLVGRRFVAIS